MSVLAWTAVALVAVAAVLASLLLRKGRRQGMEGALRLMAEAAARRRGPAAAADEGALGEAVGEVLAALGRREPRPPAPAEPMPCSRCARAEHARCARGWLWAAGRGACGCACTLPPEA